jgi:hypothetical protein
MEREIVLVDVFSRRDVSASLTDQFAVAANGLTVLNGIQRYFVTGGNGIENCDDRGTCLDALTGRQQHSSDGYVVIRMQ